MSRFHILTRRVAYYETDAMGVVHHSNHIRFFEEGRVAFLRDSGLMRFHQPEGPFVFAVVRLDVAFTQTARFDDELQVWTQVRVRGLRIEFQYALYSLRLESVIATGTTELVAIASDMRPKRLPEEFVSALSSYSWDKTWPPSS